MKVFGILTVLVVGLVTADQVDDTIEKLGGVEGVRNLCKKQDNIPDVVRFGYGIIKFFGTRTVIVSTPWYCLRHILL